MASTNPGLRAQARAWPVGSGRSPGGRAHQPRHPLASHADALGPEFGVDARRAEGERFGCA